MMHVLVTGGTGFVGRHLCRELDDRGHDVTALSRSPDDVELPAGVATVRGDVTDRDSLEPAVAGMDAVVHLVALSPLFKTRGGADRHEEVTVGGTRNVVRAAEAADVDRLVYLSALGVDPESDVGFLRSKGRAEEIVRTADLDWVILRPSIIFGEGDEFTDFIAMLTTPYVTALPGGGRTMTFEPIWIEDLLPLLAAAVEDEDRVGETYEIGGPERLSLADVTRILYRSRGQSVSIIPIPVSISRLGLGLAGVVPFSPLGWEQAKSLRYENVTEENDLEAFGVDSDDLTTYGEYLRGT